MGCASSVNDVHAMSPIYANYELGSQLGKGGFATVRFGQSKSSQRDCAVKIMELHGRDPAHTQNIRNVAENEVALWSRLGPSEHCVQLFEFFAGVSAYYLVMELCEASLLDRMGQLRSMGDDAVSRAFREMLLGTRHVHTHGVVHRDVKLGNFLLGGSGGRTLKLCDFGLAAPLPKLGVLTEVVGSSLYMSPELLGGCGYTEKTDVWSLGVTCYAVLFGDVPYRAREESLRCSDSGDARQKQADIDAILQGHPAPAFRARAGATGKFAPSASASEFVRRLLERSQNRRMTSTEALGEEFVRPRAVPVAFSQKHGSSSISLLAQAGEPLSPGDTLSTRSGLSVAESLSEGSSAASVALVRSSKSLISIPRAVRLGQATA